jgi:hypothetical protein
MYNAHNNMISTHKKVVLQDVDDLCIIETDDLIFVSKKSSLINIRQCVAAVATHNPELV